MDYQQFAANANMFNNAFLGMPDYSSFIAQPAISSNEPGKEMKSETDATKSNQDEMKSQIQDIATAEKMWSNGGSDNMAYQLNPSYPKFEQLQQYQMQLQQQKPNPNINLQNATSSAPNISFANPSLIVANSMQQALPQFGIGNSTTGGTVVQKQFQLQPQTQPNVAANPQKSTQESMVQPGMYPTNIMNGNIGSNPYQLSPQNGYFPIPPQMQGFPCVPPYFPMQMVPPGQQQFMPLPPMQLLPYGFPPSAQQYPFFTQLSPQRQALLQQQNIGFPPVQMPKLEPVVPNQQPKQPSQPPKQPNPVVQKVATPPVQPVVPTQQVLPTFPIKIEPASYVTSTSSTSTAQNETSSPLSESQPESEAIDSTTNPPVVESEEKPVKKKAKSAKDEAGSGMPKPALSYSCLISLALKNSKTGHLSVDQIYQFMCDHFPYFNTAPAGWKNSVRHNLSLNKSFQKIEKPSTNGTHHRKGCLWAMTDTKISQLGKEVRKWASKDPAAVTRAMRNPEDLEELKLGNCVKEYQTKNQKHEKETEPLQDTASTDSQLYGSEISENSNDGSLVGLTQDDNYENSSPITNDHSEDSNSEPITTAATSTVLSTETNSSLQYPVMITVNPSTSDTNTAQAMPTLNTSMYRTILPANYVNINPSMIQAIKIGNANVNTQDFVPIQAFGQQSFFTVPRSTN